MEATTPTASPPRELPPPRNPPQFPPSPPSTAKASRDPSVDGACPSQDDETGVEAAPSWPLPPPSKQGSTVLPEDLKTPDSHVPRDPRLIRLTGVHPFNVEAPLSDLYDEGFLTTKDLHYVRNHGAVPLVEDAGVLDWEVSVEGMVQHPLTMTLGGLLRDFEQVTYPVTLVCAGNRRKEQNVVRKTNGFSWGAAGVSTALWTGVPLPELLARAGPRRGARYVCFEGADRLPNGHYGTSIKLNWAADPNRGVLVAHKMNGEALPPDHGKPLRVVIPGQIGGRSVKWLKRIVVTDRPSANWYHIYDNRVLPTMIAPDASASMPETWKDERYAIYDLNTNSATAYPAHDEVVPLPPGGHGKYRVRGYAYSGGGRRVTRVEVTLDKGRSWELADVSYPEDEYRLAPDGAMLYGGRVDVAWRETCFCWCFWELEVPLPRLAAAGDVMVRAMDEAMMVQPRDMYWSVLGMMNNPWYRVVVHHEGHRLRFEHPTQPALRPGGWMERVKKAGGNLSNGYWGERAPGDEEAAAQEEPAQEICMVSKDVKREVSMEEVRKHDTEGRPWFVVNGEVYDGTKFLEGHPGGAASIVGAAGQDISEEFLAIHSENAKAMMPDYHIGTLDAASKARLAGGEGEGEGGGGGGDGEGGAPRDVFLQAKRWSRAVLRAKDEVSSDTKVFTFALDHAAQAVGLPVGQHLLMRLRDPATREAIIRAYTPVSEAADRGALRVLVKIYRDGPGRRGGRMTQALDSLPVGHPVDFKGPVGKFEYLGGGRCAVGGRVRRARRLVMVCGGSGVTPILQVFRAVMRDRGDPTFCLVLDGNRAEEDVLCRAELDALAAGNEHRCRVVYALSRPGPGWAGAAGRMGRALFEREAGPPAAGGGEAGEMVLICGPEAMERSARAIFTDMGWAEDDLLFF